MDILTKIEEIRRQPEHIRLRWVWGLTVGCMAVIVLLWLILLKGQSFEFSQKMTPESANFSTDFDQQKKSIKDAVGQLQGAASDASSAEKDAASIGSDPINAGEGFDQSANR